MVWGLSGVAVVLTIGSGAHMVEPNAINDRGEIATDGLPAGCAPADFNKCSQAYVLIPCDRDHSDEEGCKDESEETPLPTEGNSSPFARPADAIRGSLPPETLPALRARLARRHYIPGFVAPRH
jgi:hypothetical protein